MRLEDVRVIAHRGNSAVLPENSMAAFRSANALGAHMLELDVWLSREGFPVVIHDETVDRTTTGHGPVGALNMEQLRRLAIPPLEDVLALPIPINVELKTPAAVQPVVDLIFDRPNVVVSSFDWDTLDFLHQLAPAIPLAYLCQADGWAVALERASAAKAFALNPARAGVTPELVATAHAANLRVMTFTVDDAAEARRLFSLGVDAIFTNDPARMLAIL